MGCVFVSGRHLESLYPTLVQLQGLGWFRSEPVRCLWRPGGLFIWREHAFRTYSKLRSISHALSLGPDSSFCPLGPWWNHRAAWPHPRVRGHPHGERPPSAWLMPPGSFLPGSDLENLCSLTGSVISSRKISFVFFQLCSGGDLLGPPLPESQLPPIDMFFPPFILNLFYVSLWIL